MEEKIAKPNAGASLAFWLLMLMGMSQIFAVAILPRIDANAQARQRFAVIDADNARIRQQLRQLRKTKDALSDDPFYIEFLARRELNLIRPGEQALPGVVSIRGGRAQATSSNLDERWVVPHSLRFMVFEDSKRMIIFAIALAQIGLAFVISYRSHTVRSSTKDKECRFPEPAP